MSRSKPTRPSAAPSVLIGWREWVHLPKIGVGPIIAKIDTGARSAALHAEGIKVTGTRVDFGVFVNGRHQHCVMRLVGRRRVKNSGGRSESRLVVETDVQIGEYCLPTEITLTDRTDMGVPMLIGRAGIRGRFLVHPGRSFILSRQKQKTRRP